MFEYLKTPLVSFILFVLIVNVIFYLKNMKNLLHLITFIVSFLAVAALVVLKTLEIALPKLLDRDMEFYVAIVCGVLVLVNIIFLKKKEKNEALYKEVPTALDRNILGYLDASGKLIKLTNCFFDELNLIEKEQKKWFERIAKIYYNSEEISYQELLKALEENDGTEAKLTIALKSDDGFDDEISFNFAKINVDKDDETIGYVLVAIKDQSKSLTDGFGYLLDSVDAPFAYYNDDSRNVIFRTNKSFKALLGVRGYNVTYSELRHLVYPEDLQAFDRAMSEFSNDDTYFYRMKTSLGLKKFKEVKVTKDNHVISIIQMINDLNDKILDKKVVFDKVDKLISNNEFFGGMLVSLNSFVDLFNTRGPIIAKELATRYVEYLQNEVLGKEDLICKISDIEYLLLFTQEDKFNSLVRDIQNKVSTVAHYEFNYGSEVISTTNSVGIVYKNENITNSSDFVKALDNALALANKDGKDDGVSLYIAEKKKESESKLTKENYSFDKVKIDLDNSFLDDEV